MGRARWRSRSDFRAAETGRWQHDGGHSRDKTKEKSQEEPGLGLRPCRPKSQNRDRRSKGARRGATSAWAELGVPEAHATSEWEELRVRKAHEEGWARKGGDPGLCWAREDGQLTSGARNAAPLEPQWDGDQQSLI